LRRAIQLKLKAVDKVAGLYQRVGASVGGAYFGAALQTLKAACCIHQ
jgi:hypothetical protein